MEKINNSLYEYQIYHGAIDVAGYVGANYASNMLFETPRPRIKDTLSFIVSDYFVRMMPEFVSPVLKKLPFDEEIQKNEMIAITSFLLSSVADGFMGNITTKKITHNLIRNAIALGTNSIVDKVINKKYI